MYKVLIATNNLTGLYNFRIDLLKMMIHRGYDVIALVPFNGKEGLFQKSGVRLVDIPVNRRGINLSTDLKLLQKYNKIIQREKPDIIITYTIKPNIYVGIIARLSGIPYVANITGMGSTFQRKGILKFIITRIYKIALKKAKIVFFENVANRDFFVIKKIVRNSQCYVLNGAGVDLDKFCFEEYPISDSVVNFLFMGRVMQEKGVDELLIAIQRLIEDGYKVKLTILGAYEENFNNRISNYVQQGFVEYKGTQLDVRAFIVNSHCAVLPSWHEGMSNTNLESASSGRPIITSNIPGCREAVIDGASGLLCEPKNADDLYRVMRKFVELPYDKKKAMGIVGRKHMEQVFDKKTVVEETMGAIFS